VAEETPLFEGRQFARVAGLQDVLLKLIYRSIFHFEEHLKVINMISGELEHEVNSAMENKHLLSLFTLEKSLVYYINALNANAVLVEKLKNQAAKIGFTPENLEFLDDTIIENNQCREQAQIYSNVLSGLMDARASIVNNNLNLLMKTLNLITIGIMLPTFVVSAFSMNVAMPFDKDHPVTFWLIIAAAGSSAIALAMWFRYKRW